MHGTPISIMAEIGIPDAWQCLRLASPFLAVTAFVIIWRRADQIIDRLFPNWDWERKLGWLNFAAQQRAESVLRWLGYFVYALLALALFGILWAAEGLARISQWSDALVLQDLLVRVPVLLVSLGFWLFYLGCELIPKMHGEYEEEELEKFRAEQKELDLKERMNPLMQGKARFHKQKYTPEVEAGRLGPKGPPPASGSQNSPWRH